MCCNWWRPFVNWDKSSAPTTMVIGAGLVGPLWALVLKEIGVLPQLYEKRADPSRSQESGRSVNLVITARGVNALQTIGLWDQVKALTTPVFGRMVHDKEGEQSYQPYGRDESECNYSISRSELNRFLQTECIQQGISIHFEHALASVDLENKEAVFQNGFSSPFKRLFAADGGGSVVRQALKDQLSTAFEDSQPFAVGYKEMLMPALAGGEYALKKNALHIWPRGREMLMALPNRDGSFTMTLFMSQENFATLDMQAHFQEKYSDTIPLIPDYLDQLQNNPLGSFGTIRFVPWVYEDSVCLLGDAAHAIVPFFGQGLNCGFEDCALLYNLWHRYQDWQQTLAQFDEIQRPNGEAIATMAIENYTEMAERVGDDQFRLRKKIEHKIETTFPQLYRSRYGMVTYTLIPYHLAYQAGEIQNEILEEILSTTSRLEDLDLERARGLIEKKLSPFLQRHHIAL